LSSVSGAIFQREDTDAVSELFVGEIVFTKHVGGLATMPLNVTPSPPIAGPAWRGVCLGIVTAFGQAIGSLLARPAMASGVEPFTAMALRSGLAAIFSLALMSLPIGRVRQTPFQPSALGLALASAFFGTALAMSLLMAALHTGDVGIVSTLSSMTPVLILHMVWIRTGNCHRRAAGPARFWQLRARR
jgi:drug/metabolite transporter (DMT)-like permease